VNIFYNFENPCVNKKITSNSSIDKVFNSDTFLSNLVRDLDAPLNPI